MKILVVGSGGREHTLVWKISQSEKVDEIYCAPGNGGTGRIAENVDISSSDIEELANFAEEKEIDLTVVGPEAPLAKGITDEFKNRGLKIFGPTKEGAKLEASKVFSKEFMKRYGIPTADFKVFSEKGKAVEYVEERGKDIVVKADGLAGGKGVYVCDDSEEAEQALEEIMEEKKFGPSGNKVVISDKLVGEEASMIVLCDGENILPLASSQDHKPIYEGDKGPNTGGMGAYSPAPVLEGEMFDRVIEEIVQPLLKGIQTEIQDYKGVLYVGLMITDGGPYVLEFNVRFGDPELQAIAPRLSSDLVPALEATVDGELEKVQLSWKEKACVCVVMASGGYPIEYEKGKIINGLKECENLPEIIVFHAGTKVNSEGEFITDGGRVLGVTALGDNIKDAIDRSYKGVEKIDFDKTYFRKDIGRKALTFTHK